MMRAAGTIIPQICFFAYNDFVGNFHHEGTGQAKAFLCDLRVFVVNYKENVMRRMFGFLIGILVGGLVGSTVALLLAPEAGEKLRNEIRARGEGLINDIRRAGEARRIELSQQIESLKSPHTD